MKSILPVFVAGVLAVASLSGCGNSKASQYDKAKALMESEEYSQAAEVLVNIKDYEDSAELYNSCMYEQGIRFMSDGSYTDAKECFEDIVDYKESKELIAECDHMIAVKNDKIAPVISGIKEGDVLEVKFNEDYNLNDYLASVVTIEDDVTEGIDSYSVSTDSSIYDKDNGNIDTLQDGSFDFVISAADEAGNQAKINFTIHIDATLYITKDSEFPVLLYENELGKYLLNSVKYYGDFENAPEYIEGYYFEMDMQNDSDKDTLSYFGEAYLNDYRIGVYTDMGKPITPGKKGILYSYILDEDITEEMEGFNKIECTFFIGAIDETDVKEVLFRRPVIIEKEAID